MSANALRRLPPELAGCDAIEELDASSNQLTGIPTELGQCQKLKALVLDSNKITGVRGWKGVGGSARSSRRWC